MLALTAWSQALVSTPGSSPSKVRAAMPREAVLIQLWFWVTSTIHQTLRRMASYIFCPSTATLLRMSWRSLSLRSW